MKREIEESAKKAKSQKEIEGIVEKVSRAVVDIEKELIAVYENRQKQYGLQQANIYVEQFKSDFRRQKKEIEAAEVFPATTCIQIYAKHGSCIKGCISDLCHAVGVKRYALFLPDNNYELLRCGEIKLQICRLIEENPGNKSLCGQEFVSAYVENLNFAYDYVIISEMEGYPIALLHCIEEFLQEVDGEAEKTLLKGSLSEICGNFNSSI